MSNTATSAPKLELTTSRHFNSWLAAANASLVFSTYEAGKLFFIGSKSDGSLSIFERTFARCMGIHAQQQTLYVGTLYQLWRFENTLQSGGRYQDYDRYYVPRVGYTTGDVDIHDVAVDAVGRPIFVNTLFSCLATVSERYSFEPVWHPPFISKLAAEDRCHLNGLAMRDGAPAYVTCVAQTDVNQGWRDHRVDGGVVVDVRSDDVVCRGLSMPHSPRFYRDRLWLLNSGTGEFGYCDIARGTFEPVAFCPGYARGLAFVGDYAIVGLSKPRENRSFTGLALDQRLIEKNSTARCALEVIDLRSGDIVHELRIEGIVSELYDVAALPGVRQPMALGFKTEEIQRVISLPPTD